MTHSKLDTDCDGVIIFYWDEVAEVNATWELVKENLSEYGLDIFTNLFLTFPENQKLFPSLAGWSIDRLRTSVVFRDHTDAAMLGLTTVIENLARPRNLVPLLTKLGGIHTQHSVPVQALRDFRVTFMDWLRFKLGGKRASKMTLFAFDKMLRMLVETMQSGMSGSALCPAPRAVNASCVCPCSSDGDAAG